MDGGSEKRVQLYCPNCGRKIIAEICDDGALRTTCPCCHVRLFSKQKKSEIDIKVRAKSRFENNN